MNQFEYHSACVKDIQRSRPNLLTTFISHIVSKWRTHKYLILKKLQKFEIQNVFLLSDILSECIDAMIKKHIFFCPCMKYSSDIAVWVSKLYRHKWRQLGNIWLISQHSDWNSVFAKTGIEYFMNVFLIDFWFMCLIDMFDMFNCKLDEFSKRVNFGSYIFVPV